MTSEAEAGQMTTMSSAPIFNLLDAEDEEEENYDEEEESDDDVIIIDETHVVTPIRNLQANTSATFRGIVLWKKQCFLARNGKTYISRVRVGDASNYHSIIQISGLGQAAKWIQNNLEYGKSYEFEGLRLIKSNRRFVPNSHEVEARVQCNISTAKEIPTPPSFPTRMYYNIQNFTEISQLISSSCIEIVGVIHSLGDILRRGDHYIRKVTLVDDSKYKLEFYLWNEDLQHFHLETGCTLLLQGLKVMFLGNEVDFAGLRCKHMEINPQLKETDDLKRWWIREGSTSDFVDFPRFTDRFEVFTKALKFYNENSFISNLTIKSVAEMFHINQVTLNKFFHSNGVRVYHPVLVKKALFMYKNKEEGQTDKEFAAASNVSYKAFEQAKIRAGKTKKRNKKMTEKIRDLWNEYKNTEGAVTMKKLCAGTGVKAATVRGQRSRNGDADQNRGNDVARAFVYWLDHSSLQRKEVVRQFNESGNLEKAITVGNFKQRLFQAKTKYGDRWQQYFRERVVQLTDV